MRTGFAWAALIALGAALLAKIIHYGYHLYAWFVSDTPNETFDTSMAVVAALCVIVSFFLLAAALLLGNPKVQKIIRASKGIMSNRPKNVTVAPAQKYDTYEYEEE